MNREDFKQELETLINRFSLENGSDTPDFILAKYLWDCLNAFNQAVAWREYNNGRKSNIFSLAPEPLVNCLNTIDQPDVSGLVLPKGSEQATARINFVNRFKLTEKFDEMENADDFLHEGFNEGVKFMKDFIGKNCH